MSQTYNLGKVAITPRGAYSSTAQYTPLDILSYNGSSYLVLQDCMGVTPPNATYYMVVASKGDTGSSGASPTIAAGTVTMTPAGTSASVTNVGTNVNASFNFTLPNGNVIYTGTGVTGTSTTPTVFSGSGVSNAGVGDIYINTSTVAFYRCALGGAASTAKWAFLTYAVPDGSVTTEKIADGAVTSNKIANNSITDDELADGAVLTAKIDDGAVTNAKIATAAVSGTQIASETITAENIADETLTEAKLDPTFVASLAKVDGAYEQMTVGNAEQLVSTVGVSDSAPYNFRTTGGSADVGDRMNLKAVVGGTVAWNQLVQNGNFQSDNGWSASGNASLSVSNNIMTVHKNSGTGISGGLQVNFAIRKMSVPLHKYLCCFTIQTINGNVNLFPTGASVDGNTGYMAYPNKTAKAWIWDCQVSKPMMLELIGYVGSGVTSAIDFTVENYMCFDLTAMFGSTIADYVYTLEGNTEGSGVAWLQRYGFFTKPYYPYAEASLQSVKTSSHKTIGFNQWDEEWERGGLPNGVPDSTVNKIRSKNYCRCVENTVYYGRISGTYSLTAWFYDANNNVIGSASASNRTFTTPNSACYFKLAFESGYGTSYNDDVCINLSWDGERDGEYEPYVEHTYALDDVELRGIPKLDANNNLYYDGDTYEADGTVTRRYGIVDLGTLDWEKPTATNYMNFRSTGISSVVKRPSTTDNGYKIIICSKYSSVPVSIAGDNYIYITAAGQIRVKDTSNASLTDAQFKAAMGGVYLVYELDTPTTESADAYTELQICSDWGVEEFVDATYAAGNRDFEMPCGNNAIYAPNLRAKLEMSPNSPDAAGDFIVRQTDGTNEYVPVSDNSIISGLSTRCPSCPTDTDGNFVLKAVVSSGTVTYSWVSA